jgi:hypothetical protein
MLAVHPGHDRDGDFLLAGSAGDTVGWILVYPKLGYLATRPQWRGFKSHKAMDENWFRWQHRPNRGNWKEQCL